jgi:hypothetical protein
MVAPAGRGRWTFLLLAEHSLATPSSEYRGWADTRVIGQLMYAVDQRVASKCASLVAEMASRPTIEHQVQLHSLRYS